MAARSFIELKGHYRNPMYLGFNILPNGSGTPTFGLNGSGNVLDLAQGVVSVVRNSTGNFTINLRSTYKVLKGATVSLQLASVAQLNVVVSAVNVTTPGSQSVTIQVTDNTGTAQDISSNASNAIHCRLMLDN